MPSLRSRLFYHLTRRQLAKIRRLRLSIQEVRAIRDRPNTWLLKMPADVLTEAVQLQGIQGEWLRPMSTSTRGIVLYLHGGAYVTGSIKSHRRLAAKLALAAESAAFIFDYRLAPEFPFPAALEDAVAIYGALQNAHPYAPIAIAGDSAGGGLALALALHLRDQAARTPAALALLSPWTDLTLSNESHQTNADVDPFFPEKTILNRAVAAYARDIDPAHPLISPQFADLSDLPPVLMHCGEFEALLDDSRILCQRLSVQGTQASLKIYPRMWHVWQTFAGLFPEADQSVVELGEFLSANLRR